MNFDLKSIGKIPINFADLEPIAHINSKEYL
jgi:hypothetical protein